VHLSDSTLRTRANLVAREAEDDKVLLLVLIIQLLKALESRRLDNAAIGKKDNERTLVLGRETTVRRSDIAQGVIKSSTSTYHCDATLTIRTTLPRSVSKSKVFVEVWGALRS
jgi:hypothetical protein